MALNFIRRLFCRHALVERGTFKRGSWWQVLECEKCHLVKREKLMPMPTLVDDGCRRRTEITTDDLRRWLIK